jgi:outer membrane protein TolC
MQQAVANSPLLKDYQNQIRSNYYDSLLIRAANRPQVNFSSTNTYAPVVAGFGYDGAISNGQNINALFGVNKLLLSKGNLDAQTRVFQLQSQSTNNLLKVTEQDLRRTVAAQYVTTYGEMLQTNFNQEIYALLQREEVILKKMTQQNVYKQRDYLLFLVTFQQQQLTLKQADIQFRYDFGTLNYLAGIYDTTTVALQDPAIQAPRIPDIASSIFFEKYRLDSLALANNKLVLDYTYKPKVNLLADGGYLSSLNYQPYKNFGASFGIGVSFPIYDGHQKKLQYSKINLSEDTRVQNKAFFTNQYYQQIAQLNKQLIAIDGQIAQINEQIKYVQSLIQVDEKLLQTGELTIPEFVISLNSYLTAKNLLTQNTVVRLQILNQLEYWNR